MDADLLALRIKVTGGKQGAAEVKALNSEVAKSGAVAKSAASKQAAAQARLAKTATSLKSVGRGLTRYVSLPIAGVGAAAGYMALDFDRSMRNVNSIAQLPEKRFNSLKEQVLDLAGPTAQAPKTLSEGLYDLVSSGFDANESMVILKSSALAASAGLTTTEISTKAVAASLNAYHLPASKAKLVSDQLFETVNRGVVTFPELATTIGDVLPFAAQLHVGLGEVGAAISTMTKEGLSSAEATTRYKNTLVTMLKPGKDLASTFKDMGTSGEELVRKKGLQGALEAVLATTDGTKEAVGKLFPNIRAMGGVLALTGINARSAKQDLAGFKDVAGATNTVLKEQEKSFGFQLQRGWAELQVVLVEIGEQLLPVVVPMLLDLAGAARSAVDFFSSLPGPLQHTLVGLTGLAALTGPMLLFAAAVLKAATNLGILQATQAGIGLNKGRLGKMGLATGALAAFTVGQSGAGGKLGEAAGNIGGGALAGAMFGPWGAAAGAAIGAVITFRSQLADAFMWISKHALLVSAALLPMFGPLPLLATAAFTFRKQIIGALGSAFEWVINAINDAVGFIQSMPNRMLHGLEALPGLIWGVLRKTPRLLGRFTAFWLVLPIRIGYIFVSLQVRIVKALARLAPKVLALGARIVVSLIRGFVQKAPGVIGFWVSLNWRVIKFVATLPFRLIKLGAQAVVALAKGLIGASPAIWAWAKGVPGKVWHFLSSGISRLFALGKKMASEIAHGLAEGLTDLLPGPVKDALGTAGGIAGDVGGFIGGAFASGTNFAPGGLSLVGERGPELLDLPRGARVLSAPRTRAILRDPQTATLARTRGGGSTRYLVAQPIKIGRKVVAEAVTEATEDAEARL